MTDPSTSPDEREHTLPSGLKVTVRSHRTLKRADIHAVWAAGVEAGERDNLPAQHDKLMELLVTATDNPLYPVPLTAETLDLLGGADYIELYRLVGNGYRLANGLSVVPDPDDYQDPKAPTTASSGSSPASADTAPTSNPTPATTGTPGTTTSTSTAPASGRSTS